MLRFKSIIIIIITIFSFITPFAVMPYANASNVAHAQTQSITIHDANAGSTQWTTNTFNGKYIVTAFFPATGVLNATNPFTIYFFNMTTSGVIQNIFYEYQSTSSNLGSYIFSSDIAYAGNNIYYVAWQSLNTMYLGQFNLTSKALTVLNSYTSSDGLDVEGVVIVIPFSNFPVAIFQTYDIAVSNPYRYSMNCAPRLSLLI